MARKGAVEVTPGITLPAGPLTRAQLQQLGAPVARIALSQVGDEETAEVPWAKIIAGILTGAKVMQMDGLGVVLRSANFVADAKHFYDGSVVGDTYGPGLPRLTSATANFTSADIGRTVIAGAIPDGTTITAVPSATEATLSTQPPLDGSNVAFTIEGRPAGIGWALFGDGHIEINAPASGDTTVFRGRLELPGFSSQADGTLTMGASDFHLTITPIGDFLFGQLGAVIGIEHLGRFFAGGLTFGEAVTSIDSAGNFKVRNTATSVHEIDIGAIGTFIEPVVVTPDGGAYDTSANVYLNNATQGARIFYTITTDGSTPADPTTASTAYTGVPIAISAATVKIKAIAYKLGEYSAITAKEFTEDSAVVSTPVITPPAGNYSPTGGILNVTLGGTLAGCSLRYTTDGVTTPTNAVGTLVSPPNAGTIPSVTIQLTAGTRTVKVIAFKTGLTNSAVVTSVFVITTGGGGSGGGGGGGGGGYWRYPVYEH